MRRKGARGKEEAQASFPHVVFLLPGCGGRVLTHKKKAPPQGHSGRIDTEAKQAIDILCNSI